MRSDLRTALVLGCLLPCIPTDPLGIGDDVVLGGGDPLATVAALVAGGAKGFVVTLKLKPYRGDPLATVAAFSGRWSQGRRGGCYILS
jgi:hypothetical protein